jgi:hypothetical protein
MLVLDLPNGNMAVNFYVSVTAADPTAPTLTPSPATGVICPGTSVSANILSTGSDGVSGCVDSYQYRKNGGDWQPYTPGAVITDDNTNTSVEIRALREHPDGLGCSAENIYEWTFDKKVQNKSLSKYYCTIQEAINDASAGNTIVVSNGTYPENLQINIANLTVKAIGAVTIKDVTNPASWSGAGGPNMPGRDPVVFIKANGVTFEGFNIRDYQQKVGSPYIFSVVRVEGDDVTVKGLDMQSQYDVNYLASASYELIVVAKGNNVTIENNTLVRAKQNTSATAILKLERELATGDIVGNVLLKGNTVMGGPVAVRLNPNATITVQNNNISDVNYEGLWVALETGADVTGHLIFSGNTVSDFDKNCGTCSAIKVTAKPATINTQTTTVGMLTAVQTANPLVPSWNFEWMGPVHNVTQDLYYTAIQTAINAADTDDEIQVAAGTFNEEINLNKKINLKGANAGIAAGANPGTRVLESIIDGGLIVSADATIDGFNIKNGRTSGSIKVGVAVATSGVTITNCIIEDVLSPAQSDGVSTQPANNNLTLS